MGVWETQGTPPIGRNPLLICPIPRSFLYLDRQDCRFLFPDTLPKKPPELLGKSRNCRSRWVLWVPSANLYCIGAYFLAPNSYVLTSCTKGELGQLARAKSGTLLLMLSQFLRLAPLVYPGLIQPPLGNHDHSVTLRPSGDRGHAGTRRHPQ